MKEYLQDQELLFQRIKRAQAAVINAKRLDGAKDGRTIAKIWDEMHRTDTAYFRRKNSLIIEAEELNASPTALPGDFISGEQIMSDIGEISQKIVTEGNDSGSSMDIRFNRYLTNEILQSLTQHWLALQNREFRPEAEYYYNNRFCSGILGLQRRTIENRDVENVNFYIEALDRPIIYTYLPNEPVQGTDKIQSLISDWEQYEKVYEAYIDALSIEELDASRGDYIVADWPKLYTENGQTIFEVESLKFRDYVNAVYKLRDEHPECFGQGASVVIDSLYKYYKCDFSDRWDLTKEKFKLEATKQFLYLSNDDKQLRIDLFRHIDLKSKQADEVFTGGLYHVFDHFKGLRVSTKSKGDYELQEERLFEIIRDLLFNQAEFKKKRISKQEGEHWGDEYIATHVYATPVEYGLNGWDYSQRKWKGIFVLDLAKDLFYLDTLHITKAGKGEIAER